jgi:hypothetical protein
MPHHVSADIIALGVLAISLAEEIFVAVLFQKDLRMSSSNRSCCDCAWKVRWDGDVLHVASGRGYTMPFERKFVNENLVPSLERNVPWLEVQFAFETIKGLTI